MQVKHCCTIPPQMAGKRLDKALAELYPEYSRNQHKHWIEQGKILIDGDITRPRQKLQGGERVEIDAEFDAQHVHLPEHIPLSIVYQDQDLIVVDKPAGMVVHPAPGHRGGTLLNALLNLAPEVELLPRCGIVHRLDKDTTGLLMIARSPAAHRGLVQQIQSRTVKRDYLALVYGVLVSGGTVDQPLGRHRIARKKMAISQCGKRAITHYRVRQRYRDHTLLEVSLETGRTHQIRVHLTDINHPVVGDTVYGGRARFPQGSSEALRAALQRFKRQALHAFRLTFQHPVERREMMHESPLPDDFKALLTTLGEYERESDS